MAGDGGLRHVVKRRVHLERAQPDSRKRLGLLEKHKDYVLRARDYHKKEKALKALREKALLRNPDEFYFKMTRSKLDDKGRFVPLEESSPSFDQKKRMNIQNANLVTLKNSVLLKKFLRAEQRLHHVGASQACHKFFPGDEREAEETVDDGASLSCKRTSDVEVMNEDGVESDWKGGSASLLDPAVSLGVELLPHTKCKVASEKVEKAAKTALSVMESIVSEYENLAASKKRVGKLHRALELIELQKNLMPARKGAAPPHVRKVKGSDGERVCHRWEARRKR